jgi:hypothetical protein
MIAVTSIIDREQYLQIVRRHVQCFNTFGRIFLNLCLHHKLVEY